MKAGRRLFAYLTVFIMVVLGVFTYTAQVKAQDTDPLTCPEFAERVLADVGNVCSNLSRNTACFGHPRIDYTRFTQAFDAEYFTRVGDRADLTTTETIQTGPFNLLSEEWGVDVMSVQGNLPNSLVGNNGIVYIHTGGVEVENDILPSEAVILPPTGINVTSIAPVDLLTDPPSRLPSEFARSVPSGSLLSADALDETGDYVRVIYQNYPGWVERAALDSSVNLSSLPSIGPESFTPMQSFYFRVGIGGISCVDAPSLLFIQGPAGIPVDYRVHLHDIRIDSSVIMRTVSPGDDLGDYMELITVFGLARIHPGAPDEIIVPPGFYSRIPFCPVWASLGIEGDADEKATCGSWSQPRPLSAEDLAGLGVVEHFPENVINHPVHLPEVIHPSSIPSPLPHFAFPDSGALTLAQGACLSGELSEEICEYLGL